MRDLLRVRSAGAAIVLLLVACTEARPSPSEPTLGGRIHPVGFAQVDAGIFHGTYLREHNYDFEPCGSCHGLEEPGGRSGISCTNCHEDGPSACETCHTARLLDNGAHRTHVGDVLDFSACGGCHQAPSAMDSPGHVWLSSGAPDPAPAEVVITGLGQTASSTYDSESKTCSQVYCHNAGNPTDTAATRQSPNWFRTDTNEAGCGSCHGLPPSTHAPGECVMCHSRAINAERTLVPSLHIDGAVSLGRNDSECSGCHGNADNAAPPAALTTDPDARLLAVGAHQVHVTARHRLSSPLPCSSCHADITSVTSVGHLDSALPAEVFPAGSSSIAFADGANPIYDVSTGRCAGVYCHGGGESLQGDTSPGRVVTPSWSALDQGQASCGSCHGLPPSSEAHVTATTLTTCAGCHPSVDTFGNIQPIAAGEPWMTLHINGVVETGASDVR